MCFGLNNTIVATLEGDKRLVALSCPPLQFTLKLPQTCVVSRLEKGIHGIKWSKLMIFYYLDPHEKCLVPFYPYYFHAGTAMGTFSRMKAK